ncbi:hypothetical protein OEZ60_05840 [Defluviimonas sp. WL0024]|uniref:Dolichyl-phosphate-mannose-protein mannosyltransferase n=1 Tax=Albidovulum salinarum TaxID=2984153 RepID=A0ABT2X0S7_9RHOB|nr:hypothetical protein [Defluviimonas sp. WL0024]MCU9847523.1 hypothetical protein [Defluviimonas sp. WL0024]
MAYASDGSRCYPFEATRKAAPMTAGNRRHMVRRSKDRTAPASETTRRALWSLLAAALCLSVWLANGPPLFYYDTIGFLEQGESILSSLGLPADAPATATPAGAGAEPGSAPAQDRVVNASRSAIYALLLAGMIRAAGSGGMILLNLGLLWLAVRVVVRQLRPVDAVAPHPPNLTAVALAAACLGSAPFYVAFLMPDIFAPVLILMLAALCAFWPRMDRIDRLAATAHALAAILVHPSHLLMAAVILPVGLLLSPATAGRRWWTALGLIGLLVGTGVAERLVFGYAVERFEKKTAHYLPFVTARLIDDGPGRRYLAAHCPDPDLATCALFDALQAGADPKRFDAPNIIFAQSRELGSLRRLPVETQQAISHEQLRFLADVARSAPAGLVLALLRNVATQIGYFRIDMTIPTEALLAMPDPSGPSAGLGAGRLSGPDRQWLAPLAWLHGTVYLLSALALAGMCLDRRRPAELRTMTVLVLFGIVVNAAVCGGLSEPAHRYGARVMFLLPLTLALLLSIRAAKPRTIVIRRRSGTGRASPHDGA